MITSRTHVSLHPARRLSSQLGTAITGGLTLVATFVSGADERGIYCIAPPPAESDQRGRIMTRLAAVVTTGVFAAGGVVLAAQPAAAATPPATCGFWGDQSGPNHAHYGNCTSKNQEILVHTWVGSNRTECVLAESTKDLRNGFNIRTAEPDGKSC